ncbi:hypothetical protein FRB94_005333 [Tulasnella sp. JGI-2019a]|nr:hypothetical protein FRB93_002781 [Tulasnella sp. JGI-2019a]KAG9000587.1 hypothetical protein FRB94_005333 [Tulasnella sp. JGI-2019a]
MHPTVFLAILSAATRVASVPVPIPEFERQRRDEVNQVESARLSRSPPSRRDPFLSKASSRKPFVLIRPGLKGALSYGDDDRQASSATSSNPQIHTHTHQRRREVLMTPSQWLSIGRDTVIGVMSGAAFTAVLAGITAKTGGNPFSRTWNYPIISSPPQNSVPGSDTNPPLIIPPTIGKATTTEHSNPAPDESQTVTGGSISGTTKGKAASIDGKVDVPSATGNGATDQSKAIQTPSVPITPVVQPEAKQMPSIAAAPVVQPEGNRTPGVTDVKATIPAERSNVFPSTSAPVTAPGPPATDQPAEAASIGHSGSAISGPGNTSSVAPAVAVIGAGAIPITKGSAAAIPKTVVLNPGTLKSDAAVVAAEAA